jgi:hypothetical protein
LSRKSQPEVIYRSALIDPRAGDVEDDASSTKARKLTSIAGTILAEISITKFLAAWFLLVVVPGILLGLAPLVLSAWLSRVTDKVATLSGLGSLAVLFFIITIGIYGLRPLLRLVELSFWALQAIAVQPIYALFREVLSQVAESRLPSSADQLRRTQRRSSTALASGLLSSAVGFGLVLLVWPHTRWEGTFADLMTPVQLIIPALANTVAIGGVYLAAASMLWAIADATMHQPQELEMAGAGSGHGKTWHIAHLSDLHTVGEAYGFRLESGRSGPQGNSRLARVFEQLSRQEAVERVDVVLITGDMTDTGRSAEWIEFLDVLACQPQWAERALILPGNHDVNVVDRSNPARLELPTSPMKQLRQMRTLSAMVAVQGHRVRVYDRASNRLGETLADKVKPFRHLVTDLADQNRVLRSGELSRLWVDCFPQILPPEGEHGLGIIILNSNSESNFSFTNALGLLPWEDVQVVRTVIDQFPGAGWIVALHHHLMEYPMPVSSLSERIGTALINGNWVVRQLEPVAKKMMVMHGHRHIDWIGQAGPLKIISAPSPVMEARDKEETYFYIHEVAVSSEGTLDLVQSDRVMVPGTEFQT